MPLREIERLMIGGAMQQLRRLLPRHFTDWHARYMIEGDPEERWRDCRIVDMSSAGAGLELLDANPEETAGRSIIIALQFRGEVRHAEPARNKRLRTGIQFVDLSEEHRVYLQSLAEVEAVW
jgi:hypothetical protein